MRKDLLISSMAAAAFGAQAQEPEFDFVLPEIPAIQICAIEEESETPVPFVSISVEYADTIITQATDEKGLLDFTPRSFPMTLTASCEGMMEVSYSIFEHPEEPLTILMTREPADERKNLSANLMRNEEF